MSKPQYRRVQKEKITITKDESGEVSAVVKQEEHALPAEPDFIKLYLDDIGALHNLKGAGSALLNEMLKYVNYKNEIVLSSRIRKEIAGNLGISTGALDTRLNRILKTKVLIAHGTNDYELNPFLFGRGKWKNVYKRRVKHINLSLTYSEKGVEKHSEIVFDTETQEVKEDPFI